MRRPTEASAARSPNFNTLEKLAECLERMAPEVKVDPAVAADARRPIERMLSLS